MAAPELRAGIQIEKGLKSSIKTALFSFYVSI
jgi:hypothetical protein